MAARWGAGEETLTACNMEYFPLNTLDETADLSSGETVEALQSCLDCSILSIFEDNSSGETKGLDEESEATLLTALTEILDNVEDENLSPFDTLPDSDLLSGQKGREHSPLRKLLCLSRSPPEKDTLSSARPLSAGKSLPRMQSGSLQRSDGEEEEDGPLTLSPAWNGLSHDNLLDWEGLTLPLPVTFEQQSNNGVSVSLADLVRHMHPYCMAICVENDEGEQIFPEGGIVLEVVDQGENGEPILAIPDMHFPISPSFEEQASETKQKVSDEAEAASDISEHIVVDDEDEMVSKVPLKIAAPVTPDLGSNVQDNVVSKGGKEEIKEKSPSQRKKKKKCKKRSPPEPVEGRVLRSASIKNTSHESPKKPEKKSIKEKKSKVPKILAAPTSVCPTVKSKKTSSCQNERQLEITKTPTPTVRVKPASPVSSTPETNPLNVSELRGQSSCPVTAVSSQQPVEIPKQMAPASDELASLAAPVSSSSPTVALCTTVPPMTLHVLEPLPHTVPLVQEPKPKSLSLEEYRRLRQQKKPVPLEKQDNSSTKWPSLPELPKELPPIPCLPDPSPKDPRRSNPLGTKKELDDIRPAWQPRGPCAPPTPEALLVPPAYMVASSSKVSAGLKPQQTLKSQTVMAPKPSPSHNPSAGVKMLPTQTAAPQPAVHGVPPANKKCPTLSGEKSQVIEKPQTQPVSPQPVDLSNPLSKTTAEAIKPTAAAVAIPSPPQRTTVSQKVSEGTAPALFNNPCLLSKPTTTDIELHSSLSAHHLALGSPKMEPVVFKVKEKPTTATVPPRAKSPTQELIESFTSEIGIEAADLTSLLEQFEETQAKEEQSVLEVSGRVAAVGNSRTEFALQKTAVERVKANDLSSSAALTPPATPPHQMWKPLAPVTLLGKTKVTESSKSSPSKVIQIEARPLPSVRSRSKPIATPTVAHELACMDHDYCLPNKDGSSGESCKRWNIKQQSSIIIKAIGHPAATASQTLPFSPGSSAQSITNPAVTPTTPNFPLSEPLDHRTDGLEKISILETPDASPAQQENDAAIHEGGPKEGPFGRSYRLHAAAHPPNPLSSPKERTRARSRKRRSQRSPSPDSSGSESDSHSSRSRSRSYSPAKKRYRPCHSQRSFSSSSRSSSGSSCSMSPSPPRRRRYSYSSSHSGSWSRSRSRSSSPQRRTRWSSRSERFYSPSYRNGYGHSIKANAEELKKRKEKAIEERRVVYVGRIRGTMTQRELKERFSYFGEIEECTLHFRDHGDNYGFVTYYNTKDAFTAIENGGKLRKPDELPFDLCFGGRRQFCQTSYSDLDSSREYDPLSGKGKFSALDFDTLLKQAQQKLKR
ncbi:peroxisome proliferator-activated receptor gamma coactivator-related protein 1 [Aulostomus maculatus]